MWMLNSTINDRREALKIPLMKRKTVLDPVDVVTGEVYWNRVDFTLPAPIPLEWKCYYSSQNTSSGALGWGWIFSYDRCLVFEKGYVIYVDGEGGAYPFSEIPHVGQSTADVQNYLRLRRISVEYFELLLPENIGLTFKGSPETGRARLDRILNREAFTIDFHYSNLGYLDAISDSANRTLKISTDRQGRIVSVDCFRAASQFASLNLVAYEYDDRGDLVAVIDGQGNTTRYAYDNNHRLVKRTNRNGYSFHYRYEGNRCRETRGDDGAFYGRFDYDPDKRQTFFEGFDGRRLEYRYDPTGKVIEEIDPYGHSTFSYYDIVGNLVSTTDRCGRTTIYEYDDRNRIIKETSPSGSQRTCTWNETNRPVEVIEHDGSTTLNEYDTGGYLITIDKKSPSAEISEMDPIDVNVITPTQTRAPNWVDFDNNNQATLARDPLTNSKLAEWRYDLLGNIISVWKQEEWTQYTYDRLSRLVEVKYPDGTFEKNTYDNEGRVKTYTCRLGNLWSYDHTGFGQLASVTAPDGGVTQFEYTLADELCKVTDPNGNVTEYVYDMCDRVSKVIYNEQVYEFYERDAEGRLLARIDKDSKLLEQLQYEVWDLPVLRVFDCHGQSIEERFDYDSASRIIKAENNYICVQREYNDFGQITSERIGDHIVSHSYDGRSRLVQTTFDDIANFTLTYEDGLVRIIDPSNTSHVWYMDEQRIVERHLHGGLLNETFEFDSEGRVTAHKIVGTVDLKQMQVQRNYTFNAVGNLTQIETVEGEALFEYDACGRLSAIRSGPRGGIMREKEILLHDAASNYLPPNGNSKLSIGLGNQLLSWGDRQFKYDARGRLSVEINQKGSIEYSYDSVDRLIVVKLVDGRYAHYEYDALGRRVVKQIDDKRHLFGWDGDRIGWEQTPKGVRRYYFYEDGKTVSPSLFCDAELDDEDNWEFKTYSIHYDEANRPFLILNDQGECVWSASYTAYGNVNIDSIASLEFNNRAPGQYYDQETGLHYNVRRYYDPHAGRYTQLDPSGLQGGLNLYAYGEGNPLIVCDLLGLANRCQAARERRRVEEQIAESGWQPTTESQRTAYQSRLRAAELFRGQTGTNSTVCVMRIRNRQTGEVRTLVAMEGPRQTAPGRWRTNRRTRLRSGPPDNEEFVEGQHGRHAEENALARVDQLNNGGDDWQIEGGGVSRNFCSEDRCAGQLEGRGQQVAGGPNAPGSTSPQSGTGHSMFWSE
jgi:RHS repeat-associated protein